MKNFLLPQTWERLTKDQETLEIVKGDKLSLLKTPVQEKSS